MSFFTCFQLPGNKTGKYPLQNTTAEVSASKPCHHLCLGYIVLHLIVCSANVYLWRRFKINYAFIFGFEEGTELGYGDGPKN